jgi:cellulose synthase/poly-beta-1,6-N-acetylglucosamine synthase-like glycosyltransferase
VSPPTPRNPSTPKHGPTAAAINVIIPAHNESQVIGACLENLLAQTIQRPLRIIVVPNGCTDGTARACRRYADAAAARGFELLVRDIAAAGKPGALNHGDRFAKPGTRVYLDADILLSPDSLEKIAAELDTGPTLLCAPHVRIAPARSWVTRCYGRVWSQVPVVRTGVVGCGVYGVSEEGRRRWSQFPRIISDDKFVRLSFQPHERRVCGGHFTIQMPEGLRELVRVRGRWCRGNRELVNRFPLFAGRDRGRYLGTLRMLFSRPDLWPSVPVFVLVFFLGEVAARRLAGVGLKRWERAGGAREALCARRSIPGSGPVALDPRGAAAR